VRLFRFSLLRLAIFIFVIVPLLAILAIAGANWWIIHSTRHRIYSSVQTIPANDVAVVLGTSPTTPGGRYENPFFAGRIEMAAALYHAGKIKKILVSGDNSRVGYDEPTWMRDALIEHGPWRGSMFASSTHGRNFMGRRKRCRAYSSLLRPSSKVVNNHRSPKAFGSSSGYNIP
jgi:SanA protein